MNQCDNNDSFIYFKLLRKHFNPFYFCSLNVTLIFASTTVKLIISSISPPYSSHSVLIYPFLFFFSLCFILFYFFTTRLVSVIGWFFSPPALQCIYFSRLCVLSFFLCTLPLLLVRIHSFIFFVKLTPISISQSASSQAPQGAQAVRWPVLDAENLESSNSLGSQEAHSHHRL